MKIKTRLLLTSVKLSLLCSLAILLSAVPGWAQVTTNWWSYSGNQGVSPGTNWNSPDAIAYWQLNGVGTPATPTAGTVTATTTNYNFYSLTNNGTQIGNGTTVALIRPPFTVAAPSVISFPGDTLILQTNAMIRFKNVGNTGATSFPGVNPATPFDSFPGNYGFPGLILNGGALNCGNSAQCSVIEGSIYANPGSQSYLMPSDTLNQDAVLRQFIISAQLTGSGAIVLLNGDSQTAGTAFPPQEITGTSNNFTGTWVIMSGWLEGTNDGTSDGYNSLGTNTSVVFDVDPMFVPPSGGTSGGYGFVNNPANGGPGAGANAFFYNGESVIDFGSGLANLGGTLILTNGGQLYLHGIVLLSNLTVEGVSLPAGTYSYAQLAAATYNVSNNFTPPANLFPNQSGILIIQKYGPPVIPASVATPPLSEVLYPGRTATFSVAGSGSGILTYHWSSNSIPLTDGGNVSGSGTPTLTIGGVQSSDSATYSVVVGNAYGSGSASATLLVVLPDQPYEAAVSNLNPVAYYQFDEVANPALGNVPAFDYAGGFVGTYGTAVMNGFDTILGPTPSAGFPGFATTNDAIQITAAAENLVTVPSWNLNSSSVTIIAWLNPAGTQNASAGVVFCRGSDTVAGLDYNGTANAVSGNFDLGYTWNNDASTYSWDSGLVAPANQWSMVTLVVTPTQATISVMNTGGISSAIHTYPHVVQSFDAKNTTVIGDDTADGGNGSRSFQGDMDEVAVFNTALTQNQLQDLFYVATGVTNYVPEITEQPQATSVYTGQSVQLTVDGGGSLPVSYQWESGVTGSGGPYTPLQNGAAYSGVNTPTLTINSVTLAEGMDYVCVLVSPAAPAGVKSSPATVSVTAPSAPVFNITMSAQEAAGSDWNSLGEWNDPQGGLPASVSAVEYPGSIYEVLQGARLRSPATATSEVFPGVELLLDGTGVWVNNPPAGTNQGEIRLKQTDPLTGYGSVTFPLLVMNGGQMDLGNDGVCFVDGVIDVVSNGIFYSDSGDDRGYVINAQLTGSNSIQYFGDDNAYLAGYSNSLGIACNSNTFSGPWLIEAGTLLATGSNSLGTNNITIAGGAFFQTTYNITNTNSSLFLSGSMLLTQTDVFQSVFLGAANTPLPAGTHTASYLSSNYPGFFPSNWTARYGAATPTNAQGQITVLFTPGPTILTQPVSLTNYPSQTAVFSVVVEGSPPLSFQWDSNGIPLANGGNVSGATNATLTISDTSAADAASYTLILTNSVGGTTSQVATLTMLPTMPAQNITMSTQQAGGDDWNTTGFWNDGQGGLPASTDVLAFPGSTFEILPSALMRTPAEVVAQTNFPGAQLTVDGNGIWVDNVGGETTQGEIRFKQGLNAGIVYFPLLIMAGGQWDNGNASTLDVIQGNIDIVSNTPIYADDSSSTGLRPFQVDAYLFGNGSIEYHDSDATLAGGLNITCPTNKFTGTWNIVTGALLGSGSNCLGTNSIDLNTNGVLETLYNIDDPNANLSMSNGARVFLHQNDTFHAVSIGGVGLAAGTWSFTTLNADYPTNFPLSWTSIMSSTFNSASGSITVLTGPTSTTVVPIPLDYQKATNGLILTWSQGVLLQATNLAGPWATNTTATSPYPVAATNRQEFFKILVGQ
jgi:hypothetical protein